MERLLFLGIGLGLVFCATPGAVNTASLRRGLARGFRPALLVQLGSLTGDLLWAVIALSGTAFLARNRAFALLLGIVGALFLLRQAASAFVAAAQGSQAHESEQRSGSDFVVGTLFSLTNPFAIAFWLGLGASAAASAQGSTAAAAVFFVGFFLGAVLWCTAFAALVSAGRRFVTRRLLRTIDALCGAALSVFGVRLLLRSLSALRLGRFARVLIG
jgi:chemosensory pili system protein ChpE